jgi:hypothetical protein
LEHEKIPSIKDKNENQNTPEVFYIKFIDGSLVDVEEMKKILKKYGEIQKISRKIEGRSYFILFKETVNFFIFKY